MGSMKVRYTFGVDSAIPIEKYVSLAKSITRNLKFLSLKKLYYYVEDFCYVIGISYSIKGNDGFFISNCIPLRSCVDRIINEINIRKRIVR